MNIQPIIDDTKSDLQFQLAELVKLSSQEMTSTVRTKVVIQQMNKAIEQINRLQSQIEILEELK
jgi:hypothetical protein